MNGRQALQCCWPWCAVHPGMHKQMHGTRTRPEVHLRMICPLGHVRARESTGRASHLRQNSPCGTSAPFPAAAADRRPWVRGTSLLTNGCKFGSVLYSNNQYRGHGAVPAHVYGVSPSFSMHLVHGTCMLHVSTDSALQLGIFILHVPGTWRLEIARLQRVVGADIWDTAEAHAPCHIKLHVACRQRCHTATCGRNVECASHACTTR
jgi:hypothetical protein